MARVLFVCIENSCRSQMAEAFARIHGGAAVEAASCGSNPSGMVNPRAVAAMAELGYELGSHRSTGLPGTESEEPGLDDEGWDAVVTMGCGDACPQLPAKLRLNWNIPDPAREPMDRVRRIRDDIECRVRDLLGEVAAG